MDRIVRIRTAGGEFLAQQRGEQPRVVFLHGFGGDLHTWDWLWEALGNDLAALRYDLRGYGGSVADAQAPFSHAEDLLAILDALAIPRCDLVGVSMGGAIALNFALDHPERVRSLVLISPALVAWEWSQAWTARWDAIVAQARAGALERARQLWWEHPLFASTRRSAAASALHESILRFPGRQWIADVQRPALPDLERLHTLKAPTLLLSGGRDLDELRLIADLIQASAPDVRRIDEPACGHLLHLEDPRSCARHLLDFFRSLKTSTAV